MIEEQESNDRSFDIGEYFWLICYLPPLLLALGGLFPLFFYAPFYGTLALYSLGLCCVLRYVSSPTLILSLFILYAFWVFPSAPQERYNYNVLWTLSLSCSLWLCVQASRALKSYWQTTCTDAEEASKAAQLWQARFGNLQEKHERTEDENETLNKSYAALQEQAQTQAKDYQEMQGKYQRIQWEFEEAKATIAGLRDELAQQATTPAPKETVLSELREKERSEPASSNRISLQDIANNIRK